ncbi:MAG: type I-C CRISPR-associated protein Cas8c/Csd1 [Candidatus Sumerlaeota bacterium]|nr:type I-C CRISPR-associated protein Cas8c/Csd1 [Candidatus Sumerlaeota bacterium]
MLNLLIDYAQSHGLTVEPGFKPKTVRWAIVCDREGRFLNVQELGDPGEKNNRGRVFNVCPDLTQPEMKAGGSGCRHYLVDNVEVVALFGKDGDLSRDPKARAKHNFFVSLLRQSADVMKELGALATMLDSAESLAAIQEAFAAQRAKPTDGVTLAIAERTPTYLVEDDAWRDWWRGFRLSLLARKSARKGKPRKQSTAKSPVKEFMRCFGKGEFARPVLTHWPIEGLSDVGGLGMGDFLASFKQESFNSYFLTQSQNAAVSEDMAAAYRAGLNSLIKKHAQQLAGAKVVHWYAGATEVEEQEDPMTLLDDSLDLSWLKQFTDEENEERDALHLAKVFLDSLKSGENPRLSHLANYQYYAMILSANSGRMVAREWVEGQFGELAESIVAWFEALEVTNISGDHSAKSPKIERVITSLLPALKPGQKYADWIKPVGGERSELWHAAISSKVPIPSKVLSRLVPLHQAFMLSGDFEDALDNQSRNRARNLSLLYARMGLFKAYHIRKGDRSMQPYLNEEHPHPAYHCGRLMAVYADLQHAALGDVGAGVVQRYYAAASATPALILGRLGRGSQFHLNKLEGGLAYWYEQRLAAIWGRIKDTLPRTLTLEEQSLFALGYYQQKAARKSEAENEAHGDNQPKGE